MRESTRRDNYLAFLSLPWAQAAQSATRTIRTLCARVSKRHFAGGEALFSEATNATASDRAGAAWLSRGTQPQFLWPS